jgi:hypothetical protein
MSRKRSPCRTAIAAALLLIVQAFLSGAGIGAQAAAGPHDVFGNVLCTADAGSPSPSGPHGGAYDCDCCLSGCDFGAAIIPQPSGIGTVPLAYLTFFSGKRLTTASVRRQELEPLSPRGPPAPSLARLGERSARA